MEAPTATKSTLIPLAQQLTGRSDTAFSGALDTCFDNDGCCVGLGGGGSMAGAGTNVKFVTTIGTFSVEEHASAGPSPSEMDCTSGARVGAYAASGSSSSVEWWIIMLVIVVPLAMFAAIGAVIWKMRPTTQCHDTAQMASQEAHTT